jgi:hypothetical protein
LFFVCHGLGMNHTVHTEGVRYQRETALFLAAVTGLGGFGELGGLCF